MERTNQVVIGIRAEDKNKWERRVPLTPAAVKQLVDLGFQVVAQPSPNRIFRDVEFARAGAALSLDLNNCNLVLAVKEVPVAKLLPNRAYCFFSHTIKAQPANMPLLDALLKHRIRLYDYECLTERGERGGKRLVAFGKFAGLAGMLDFFSGVGARLLSLGHSTPLLELGHTYMYPTLAHALRAVREAGDAISSVGLPPAMCPLTIAITGDGNVAHGAREVVEALGPVVRWVQPSELKGIVETATGTDCTHVVYACIVTAEHMVARRDDPAGPFDKGRYKAHPEEYEPTFHTAIAPYVSLLSVCHYWEPRFPRLLTVAQTQELASAGRLRLLGITDISADFMGSIEFGREFRPIESPFYCYDPASDAVVHDMDAAAPAILYHCVDHLPSECAREASEHFSTCLLPLIPAIARASLEVPVEDDPALPAEVRGSAITDGGHLTRNFGYIAQLRAAREKAEASALARRAKEATPVLQVTPAAPGAEQLRISTGPLASPASAATPLQALRSSSFLALHVSGHVFDSGWVNQGLDICEALGIDAAITSVAVGKDRDTPTRMSLVLAVRKDGQGGSASLTSAVSQLRALAASKGVVLSIDADEGRAAASGATALAAGVVTPAAGAQLGLELEAHHPSSVVEQPSSTHEPADVGLFLGSETPKGAITVPTARPGYMPAEVALSPAVSSALPRSRSGLGLHSMSASQLVPSLRPAVQPVKRVLMLGAGLVAGPALTTLLRRPYTCVTLASVLPTEATSLVARFGPGSHGCVLGQGSGVVTTVLDAANDARGLKESVARHDVVLSLLPATLHLPVARACLESKVHLVTASYVSPALAALDGEARQAGVLMLHEMGLDPGIDHLSACAIIHDIHGRGGSVTSFRSLCGGLPAPEAAMDNPLGYKFSWSPRGALVAMQNDAVYLQDGKEVAVPGSGLLSSASPIRLGPAFALEVLPNRDSRPYAAKYGLEGPALGTMFRGTLRYEGFSKRVRLFQRLGLLSPEPRQLPHGLVVDGRSQGAGISWRALLASLLGVDAPADKGAIPDGTLLSSLQSLLACSSGEAREALDLLQWARLADPQCHVDFVWAPGQDATDGMKRLWLPVDTLAGHLSSPAHVPSMSYRPGERDVALLHHEVIARFPASSDHPHGHEEVHTSTLVEYGDARATSMARTVGITAAIAVELVLSGTLLGTQGLGPGVHTPVHPAVFRPALVRLHEEGIVMKEARNTRDL